MHMLYGTKIEICAGCLQDIETADKYTETDRIEVNSHLEEDGLSMDPKTFSKARQMSSKQLMCMVRPRGGNFIYNDDEKKEMYKEARFFLEHGADGIVFGALQESRELDHLFVSEMIELIHSYHKEAVFHKAFDASNNMDAAIQELIALHCDRILTSGGRPDCMIGSDVLAQLQQNYGNAIEILPGGGIRADNVIALLKKIGCSRFHMSLRAEDPEQKLIDVLEALREDHHQGQRVLTREDQAMFEADTYENAMEDLTDTHDHF
jgi:copper homeostasis protein